MGLSDQVLWTVAGIVKCQVKCGILAVGLWTVGL